MAGDVPAHSKSIQTDFCREWTPYRQMLRFDFGSTGATILRMKRKNLLVASLPTPLNAEPAMSIDNVVAVRTGDFEHSEAAVSRIRLKTEMQIFML